MADPGVGGQRGRNRDSVRPRRRGAHAAVSGAQYMNLPLTKVARQTSEAVKRRTRGVQALTIKLRTIAPWLSESDLPSTIVGAAPAAPRQSAASA